jgi:hypothetical protein
VIRAAEEAEPLTDEPETRAVTTGEVAQSTLESLGPSTTTETSKAQFQLNEAAAGLRQASGSERGGDVSAEQVLDAGGRAAQTIQQNTASRMAAEQQDETWGAAIYQGLEMAVQTGAVRFGESVGRGAAHEAWGGAWHPVGTSGDRHSGD